MKRLILLISYVVFSQILFAQESLPIIKATSPKVDVRDGEKLYKGAWTITPKVKPDVYTTWYSLYEKNITFYTDIDSITVKYKPDLKFDFLILLNNTDSAFTQIFAPNYLKTLKESGKYNYTEKADLPKFTYRSPENPYLISFRKTFNLDSVAGNGDEISKIINILHWVHNAVLYDGLHDAPIAPNRLEMLKICMKEKRGLHCGALAWVLNDCIQSLGFKSRQVVCLPKDSSDNECHSINIVYSESLHKWLWMDATNNAFVKNEKGELLSIEEVRERLVNGLPLELNPDANCNNKPLTKEFYLYDYMAKNLYRFKCFAESTGDDGTKEINTINLLPLNYNNQTPRKFITVSKENKANYIEYKTNNPVLFWQKP